MIFRRRGDRSTDLGLDGGPEAAETGADEDGGSTSRTAPTDEHRRAVGPWDASERPSTTDDSGVVDLGGLLINGRPGLELRLQTDQGTGVVVAALLVSPDGAVELRPFAAGRSAGIWDAVRRDIVGEAARHGGTATEGEGEYGTELRVVVPLRAQDGSSVTQTSRVVGIEGPRWLLRATYLGKPAISATGDDVLTQALRDVVVVRGDAAMAPRDPLPLRLPPNAQVVAHDSD